MSEEDTSSWNDEWCPTLPEEDASFPVMSEEDTSSWKEEWCPTLPEEDASPLTCEEDMSLCEDER